MTITDTVTGKKLRVCRTYRATDGRGRLHVTDDRRVWLNYGGGRASFVGRLGDRGSDTKMTRYNARRAANA